MRRALSAVLLCLVFGYAPPEAAAKESLEEVINDLRQYAAQAKALARNDAAGIKELESKVDKLSWRISTSSGSNSSKADAARKAVDQLEEYLRNKPYEGDRASAIGQELSRCERLARAMVRRDEAKCQVIEEHLDQLTLRTYRVVDASSPQKGALHLRIAEVRQRLKELPTTSKPKEDESATQQRGPLVVDPPLDMQKFNGKELETKEKIAISNRLDAVLDKYDKLPEPISIGRELEISREGSQRLLADTDRFLREFQATVRMLRADKAETLRIYRATDAGWLQASELGSGVPYNLNGQVWHSRFYLEAVYEGAFDAAEFGLGKDRTIVIINDGGELAVTFKSSGTPRDCVQFTHDAAKIGHYFARKIGDNPTPWIKRLRETEALADEFRITLRGRE